VPVIEPRIPEGAKVLMRPNVQVENGEVVAVIVGSDYEATLKQVFFKPGKRKLTLHPFNPAYEDIIAEAENVTLAAVFRGMVVGVEK
jgi:repressor LexA